LLLPLLLHQISALKKKKELLPYLIERQSSYLLFKKKDFSSPKSKPTPLFWCCQVL